MGLIAGKLIVMAFHVAVEPALAVSLRRRRLAEFDRDGAKPPTLPLRVYKGPDCSDACIFEPGRPCEAVGRYVDRAACGTSGKLRRLVDAAARRLHPTPMVIDLERFPDMEAFEAALRRRSSRTSPKARRAAAAGYRAHIFPRRRHVFDIHAIKTSAIFRAGGPVVDALFLRWQDVGAPLAALREPKARACPRHWTIWWGVFRPGPGHRQGEVEVDEELVAFAKLRRMGELVHYAEFMGHKAHLAANVMTLLHVEIIRWLIARGELTVGVRAVLYGGAEHGRAGLLTWKKRAGYEPAWLVFAPADIEAESQA